MTDRLEAAIRELAAALREELVAEAPAADAPPRLLSIEQACAALGGIARSTLYQLLDRGELRSVTVGRRRLIPASAIAEYAAGAR